jgi:hypothetical protein
MKTQKMTKREEFIAILIEGGNFTGTDLPYLNNLTTDQLKVLVTREDDEFVEDPELTGFVEN